MWQRRRLLAPRRGGPLGPLPPPVVTAWPRRPTYSGRGASAPSQLRQHLIGHPRLGNQASAGTQSQGPSVGIVRGKIVDTCGHAGGGATLLGSVATSTDQKAAAVLQALSAGAPVHLRQRPASAASGPGNGQKAASRRAAPNAQPLAVAGAGPPSLRGAAAEAAAIATNVDAGTDLRHVQMSRESAGGTQPPDRCSTPSGGGHNAVASKLPEARARTPVGGGISGTNAATTSTAAPVGGGVVRSSRGSYRRSDNGVSSTAGDQRPGTPGVGSARGSQRVGSKSGASRCWSSQVSNHQPNDVSVVSDAQDVTTSAVSTSVPLSPLPIASRPSASAPAGGVDEEIIGDEANVGDVGGPGRSSSIQLSSAPKAGGTPSRSSRSKPKGPAIPRPHSAQAASSVQRPILPPAASFPTESPPHSVRFETGEVSAAEEDAAAVDIVGNKGSSDIRIGERISPPSTPQQGTPAGAAASAVRLGHPSLMRTPVSRPMSPSVVDIEAPMTTSTPPISVATAEARRQLSTKGGLIGSDLTRNSCVAVEKAAIGNTPVESRHRRESTASASDGQEDSHFERSGLGSEVVATGAAADDASTVGSGGERYQDMSFMPRSVGPPLANKDADVVTRPSSSKPPTAPAKRCRSADPTRRGQTKPLESASSLSCNAATAGGPANGGSSSLSRAPATEEAMSWRGTVREEAAHCYRGEPAHDLVIGESECTLIGTEELPLIGAAGVLVLPKRLATSASRGDLGDDDPFQLGKEDLSGWGSECRREDLVPDRLLDAAHREKRFTAYVNKLDSDKGEDTMDIFPMEELKALAAEAPAPIPLQGPGLLQLAIEPKRREECPVCNAEWKNAMRQLGTATGTTSRNGEGSSRRRTVTGRGKMHSIRCSWAWFQQNLCTTLCGLRFDTQGNNRTVPTPANRILPPPIMDVWTHWKGQRGVRSDRNVADRLFKGEPTKSEPT